VKEKVMPVKIKGRIYYRTAEVYRLLGISRATLFRWLKGNVVEEAGQRDRRGWRLFTEKEIATIKAEADRIGTPGHFTTTKQEVSAGVRNERHGAD
jgi:hypothetical protein